jgi:thioredoxin/glutathione reductase (selenoprotein)
MIFCYFNFDISCTYLLYLQQIKMLNFSYKVSLRSAKVCYINALAYITTNNEIEYFLNEKSYKIHSRAIIIAVGSRPFVPRDVPGAFELTITSDDIFSLEKSPGKTLIVGGSYIALECASFLNDLNFDVTVSVRSVVLRGFDRQCSNKVMNNLEELGVKFKFKNLPSKIEKCEREDKLLVTYTNGERDLFDTVLYAVGRVAETKNLGLENVGIIVGLDGKIPVNERDETSATNVYAVGDVAQGRLELTPTAIQAGEYLARRLAAVSSKIVNYNNVPTTVFASYEYSSVGYSQEKAKEYFGKENIEVYLREFSSLELSAAHRLKNERLWADEFDKEASPQCLSKLICLKSEDEKVVGFHFIGPNAGEICQGFALAIKLGAKKSDFDELIGIHPTDAESFCTLSVTLASGQDFRVSAGCGGGKCG